MRVLLIGDGISLTTGFAQVLQHVAAALVARGDVVGQIASLDRPPLCRSEPYHAAGVIPYFPNTDPVGHTVLGEALRSFQPDIIFANTDPGRLYEWLIRLRALSRVPVVAYTPVEGSPVNHWFIEAMTAPGVSTILYSERAADEVAATPGGRRFPWVAHGVDRTVWHPLDPADRAAVRDALGWTERFVCVYVARNAGRKAQDVLIKAWPQVQRRTPDATLYLHCNQFDGYELMGWDLGWMCEQEGAEVEFKSDTAGTAIRGPSTDRLARLVAAADLLLHAAQVEGFGLPLIEAMAAGVPVVHVKDNWVMDEIAEGVRLGALPPILQTPWHTGATLNWTEPGQWARVVHWAHEHPMELAQASARGLVRAACFDWQTMTDTLLAAVDQAAVRQPVPASA